MGKFRGEKGVASGKVLAGKIVADKKLFEKKKSWLTRHFFGEKSIIDKEIWT